MQGFVHFRVRRRTLEIVEKDKEWGPRASTMKQKAGPHKKNSQEFLATTGRTVRRTCDRLSAGEKINTRAMFSKLAIPINITLREFLVIIAISFVTIWSFVFYTRDWRNRRSRLLKLAKLLPGPPTVPIVGNALRFACKPEQLLDRLVGVIKPYENVTPMRVWMGPSLYVVITSPRDIETVLNSQQASNKGMAYKFLMPFIGDGLISGSGKRWKSHRKMVAHTLYPRILRDYVEVFDRRSRILMEKLQPFADGRVFDILDTFEGCTIDIVCEAVMGFKDMNAQENPDQDFVHYTAEMYKIIHDRMMKIWLYPDCIFKLTRGYKRQLKAQQIINNFTKMCVAAKKKELSDANFGNEELNNSQHEGCSILEQIIINNNRTRELTDDELRDEIYTVYLAAQDTLALTSSFATLMLAMHQNVQNKARQEMKEIFTNADEKITAESLGHMKYLELIVKETLRLFPIAPIMVRCLVDELPLDNCTLPEGCQVVVASFITHRSERYWENPERFIPERFLNEESSKRHAYTYVPFSGGPMGCIGQKFALMSLKTILANLLRNFKITTRVKMEDVQLRADISIRSINGYKVSLQPLSKVGETLLQSVEKPSVVI